MTGVQTCALPISPGLLGPGVAGSPTFPRNLALVFGQFDEFAALMWQQPKGSLISQSPALRNMFGAGFPIAPGKIYGDPGYGTARVLYTPPVTHPWEHFSQAGVGHAVDWFQKNLAGARSPKDPLDQIWIWKEVGTLIAFLGMVVLMLGTFQLLLTAPVFALLAKPAESVGLNRGPSWWLALGLTAVIPAASFFPFMTLGQVFLPNAIFPQWIHNQLLVWALLNAIITLGIGFVLRAGIPTFTTNWPRSIAIALTTVGMGYLSLVLADRLFQVDFRFWVLGLKPLDGAHARIFAAYLVHGRYSSSFPCGLWPRACP